MTTRARYSSQDDSTLIDTLSQQSLVGNQSENGFKMVAYVAAATALEGSEEESGGRPKTAQSCRDRFLLLKKEYFIVKTLRELSGFGWDDEKHLVTAPEDVWMKYLEAHPKAKKWQKTPFPLYEEMAALVDGTSATGKGAFRPGQCPPAAVVSEDMDWMRTPSPTPSPTPPAPAVPTKRALSTSPGPSQRARKRNGKLTAANTVSELVRAVGGIKDALAEPSGAGEESVLAPSPKRRKDAITALAADTGVGLTPRRKVRLITRFRKETSIADTYLALTNDDVLRAGYLEEELTEASFTFTA